MTWPVVLLVAAAVLSTAGVLVARAAGRDVREEDRARRAITGLALLVAAIALAALGGALLGAGGTGREQFAAFAGAAATIVLPVLGVGLARGERRADRARPSGSRR